MAKTTIETNPTTPVKATFADRLQAKIEAAQTAAALRQDEALEGLLDNENFVEAQRAVLAKEQELNELNDKITQLNHIDPFKTNDGRKFGVNVYPINQFGVGLGQVMGIITGSRSAFVDETRLQFLAITGLTSIELYEAVDAIGSPAYFKDGKVHEAIEGDFQALEALLPGIFIRLGLHEYTAASISKAKFDLYFASAEAKALRQLKENDDLQKLDAATSDFILED